MNLVEIGELVLFAKEHYPTFGDLPDAVISNYFLIYQDNIIIDRKDGDIRGFALYQIWPDFYNFIITCHLDNGFRWMMELLKNELAGKKIAGEFYFTGTGEGIEKFEVREV